MSKHFERAVLALMVVMAINMVVYTTVEVMETRMINACAVKGDSV